MKGLKTITFALPADVGRQIEKDAKAENRTAGDLITKAIRQYKAKRAFKSLAAKVRKEVKSRRLTEKDFGGPFAK